MSRRRSRVMATRSMPSTLASAPRTPTPRRTQPCAWSGKRNGRGAPSIRRSRPYHRPVTDLEVARGFINAVRERDPDAAAELCAESVQVLLPGADTPLRGREGVRQMIRIAPQFLQSIRDEEERDGEVQITTLTRAPGVFANYTTWLFVINDGKVERLSFELRGAN